MNQLTAPELRRLPTFTNFYSFIPVFDTIFVGYLTAISTQKNGQLPLRSGASPCRRSLGTFLSSTGGTVEIRRPNFHHRSARLWLGIF